MKNTFAVLAIACVCWGAAAEVKETMVVARCQAILKDGRQCERQAEQGKRFCWRHSGAARAVDRSMDSAGRWTTNAWEQTKSGTAKAWKATKDAFDGARVGMIEMFGGKDARQKEKDAEEKEKK